jgi:hypothetical protein
VVGVLSDRCTSSYGRRRPFILAGLLACLAGIQLFATAGHVPWRPLALAQGVLGFAVLDFATNVIMFPSRALLGDIVAAEQQHDVQSAAAVIASVAEISAGAYIYSWDAPVTHIYRLFGVASVCLLVSVGISLIVCVEQPLVLAEAATEAEADLELQSLESDDGGVGVGSDDEDGGDEVVEVFSRQLSIKGAGKSRGSGQASQYPATDVFAIDDEEPGEVEGCGAHDGLVDDTDEALTAAQGRDGVEGEEQDGDASHALFRRPPRLRERTRYEALRAVAAEVRNVVAGSVATFPPQLKQVGLVYFLAWACWFATLPAYSVWIGESVLGGSPTAEPGSKQEQLYQNGINVFAVATLVKSFLALGFSLAYPRMCSGYRRVYACKLRRGCRVAGFLTFLLLLVCFEQILFVSLARSARLLGTARSLSLAHHFVSLAIYFGHMPTPKGRAPRTTRRIMCCRSFGGVILMLWLAILLSPVYSLSAFIAGVVVAAGSIPFIATQTIPTAIAVVRFPENLAANLGVLNIFCVSAQLFDTLYTGLVARYLGEAFVMKIGALWALAAGVAAFIFL